MALGRTDTRASPWISRGIWKSGAMLFTRPLSYTDGLVVSLVENRISRNNPNHGDCNESASHDAGQPTASLFSHALNRHGYPFADMYGRIIAGDFHFLRSAARSLVRSVARHP